MHRGERVVIGLAGNIGSGKSTAAAYFRRFGSRCIEADQIGRRILPRIKDQLMNHFGAGIVTGGRIDRKKLRAAVFTDRRNVRIMNRLTHPRLIRTIRNRIHNIRSGVVVVDAALLFNWPDLLPEIDYPILIAAPKSLKEQWAVRKGIDRSSFRRIMRFQKTEKEMARQAKYIIKNNRSLKNLYRQCYAIYKEIKNDC
jgi:dephospho-CoA kinase